MQSVFPTLVRRLTGRMTLIAAAWAIASSLAAPASAQVDARMLRFPDVSDRHIAFVYAGDIWIVTKEGGIAQRLSTPSGEELFPRFSPDGARIAFSANYDGNTDVYVVPTTGGLVERLTHHPMADRVLDWHPGGDAVLYASPMYSEKNRFNKLFLQPAAGGMPQQLPPPYGEFGSISEDGTMLAYIPISRDFRTWKRYRGGMAPDIWIFDLRAGSARNVTDHVANDTQPMWHGSTLYFLSDRDANSRYNIWAYDMSSGEARQVTEFTDFDVRFPAIGSGEIVFEAGGRLHLLDLATERSIEVSVDVVTDRSTLKPRTEAAGDSIFQTTAFGGLVYNVGLSPSGQRVLASARGDVFSLPAEEGVTRNLTRTPGVFERTPAWSPDGKRIAYFSDASGEYELTLLAADGSGEPEQVTSMGAGFRYLPQWSPDSKKIAFIDQTMTIRVFDVASRELTRVDQGLSMMHPGSDGFRVSWSPDSRWIAYARGLPNRHLAVFLFDTESGELHQATSGFYFEFNPVFGPDGDYLFLLTNRSLQPIYSDYQNTFIYTNTTNVAAVPLRVDVPSPLAPRNDDEEVDEAETETDAAADETEAEAAAGSGDETADDAPAAAADEQDAADVDAVEIDLEGFESRLVVLPPAAGNYAELYALDGKIVYRRAPRTGSGGGPSSIVLYDLAKREESTVVEGGIGFTVSASGNKLLVAANRRLNVIDPAPGQQLSSPVSTAGMRLTVDPPAEWRQIFNDVWRLQRDYFYVSNMHGVDWQAIGERYNTLLEDAVTRWDLDFIIDELIGELNVGHAYNFRTGDVEQAETLGVGLLGVNFALENGAYRFRQIIDGAPWDSEARSPLRQPGLKVSEGDYLLAVNGNPVDTSEDPWSAFQGMANEVVELTINDEPSMEGSRQVLVRTLGSEYRLRNLAWINANRLRVEEASGGRIGYAYVPDTGVPGQTELMRQLAYNIEKDALIIDERFNSGGQIPDRFVEMLNRPVTSYWAVRDGMDWKWPPIAHNGPKVMLINGWSGSGGDAFPFFFRAAGLGPLIGTRTWGGLVGISGVPQLIDGGDIAVPTFGIYSTEGEWIIEGYGVDPDIEVVEDPAALFGGTDAQLERGIAEALRLLEENPPLRPTRPAGPNRGGR